MRFVFVDVMKVIFLGNNIVRGLTGAVVGDGCQSVQAS
jgi:hypothetical protein